MIVEEFNIADTNLLPPLVKDYIKNTASLSSLYSHPFSIEGFEKAIQDKSNTDIDRALLVEVLKAQYEQIETSEIVRANIQSLSSDKTFTVVAAHQSCLFLGPLYNIYKISCAINLSKQLKNAFPAYNFVPVFWLGTEDHDVEELSSVNVNGKKITWQHTSKGASGRWSTETLNAAFDELKTINSGNPELISLIESGLKKFTSFGAFTQFFVNEIFKEYGLVVLDQDNPKLKRKFTSIIRDEIFNSRAMKVLKPSIAFLEANYKVQAKPRDINFFYLGHNFRERIVFSEASQQFEVMNTGISFTREELESEIERTPERFSPNVIFRPLYQEVILPNLAFIGGGGELSYWLQLKPLFDYCKVPFPLLGLRNSAIILTEPISKKLTKLQLSVANFMNGEEQVVNEFVKQQINPDLYLSEELKSVGAVFDRIVEKATAVDATLNQSALTEKQKALTSVQNIESKILKAEKRKQETSVNQIRSVYSAIFPSGNFQERVENFIPYYSPEFIASLVRVLNPFHHTVKVFTE
jgi:bacillithiol biosynthesis cysteine-adding enzyme BshC